MKFRKKVKEKIHTASTCLQEVQVQNLQKKRKRDVSKHFFKWNSEKKIKEKKIHTAPRRSKFETYKKKKRNVSKRFFKWNSKKKIKEKDTYRAYRVQEVQVQNLQKKKLKNKQYENKNRGCTRDTCLKHPCKLRNFLIFNS